jgi:ABC-2 type transport system ATP-binding protein
MSVAAERPKRHPDGDVPLDVRNVTKRFKRRERRPAGTGGRRRGRAFHSAVDGVSFRMEPNEIYGVIGANGSGKSTLIRMLSTLLIPDEGEVYLFGHDVVADPASARPLLNRVSADPSFFRAMSAAENLLFYGRAYGMPGAVVRRRSVELLAQLGLKKEAKEPMTELSRGQQQKVAVARAFLTGPRLLLLDEPTTGLDPRSKRTVQSFIADARDRGVAILLTTHDMEEADLLCDRLAFLAGGKIVAEGTSRELRAEVAGPSGSADDIDMEDVFMAFTGRSIEEDEEEDEHEASRPGEEVTSGSA